MPIKWTPVIDQILLLKILETSQVNVNPVAISAVWPEGFEKPTPRAISERLVKIRQTSKDNGAASHFSVSKAKSGAGPAGTPRKRATAGTNAAVKKATAPAQVRQGGKFSARGNGGAGEKRKRGNRGRSEDDATDDSEDDDLKADESDTEDEDEPPSKKAKNGQGKFIVKLEESEGGFCDSGYENANEDAFVGTEEEVFA
ncbi:hypothetical protein HO133_010350 [Letharia lupina]|uniref:Uncharacterized protein n=1 Tax=Letharia lupina TaxID=560253 RepID=A0A8H6FEQ6_9LECA|nr:uncharacterized protein HO133_010350 [Letharia lupina]KAF6225153.1 hypothetical protein HO133_010350 [Letharia lupina]